jgi:hypothetical protein
MKTQFKNVTILSAILLSTVAIPAGAMVETSGYHHAISNINLMDSNDDNRISNEEFTRFYVTSFESLDVNHDGVLSVNEWGTIHKTHQVTLQAGGYQSQTVKDSDERSVTKKAFLEYHRSFIEVINQKRAESQDPQKALAKLLGG